MTRFDEIRAERPDLGLAVYAIEPGGEVTLELFIDGNVHAFRGPTEAAVLEMAFPSEPAPPAEPAALPDDIFE